MNVERVTRVIQVFCFALYCGVSLGFVWLVNSVSDYDAAWHEIAMSVAWLVGAVPAFLLYALLMDYVVHHPKASPNPRK